jgi:hypothetical protein
MVLFKIAPYLFIKSMARYVAIFTDNHNEEFDVHGFKIMTEREVENFEELAMSITWEFSYLANDEALNYLNGEDFLSRIEFKEISKDEYDSLDKTFGGEFGIFIGEEYLESIIDDEEGPEDEEEDWDDEDGNY